MVSQLWVGALLTLLAWLGLLAATVHGKYVVEKIAAGEYDKGPLQDDEHPARSDGGEPNAVRRISSDEQSKSDGGEPSEAKRVPSDERSESDRGERTEGSRSSSERSSDGGDDGE